MSTIKEDKDFGEAFVDSIKEWIADRYDPDEIFSESIIEEWAMSNGFVDETSLHEAKDMIIDLETELKDAENYIKENL